MNKKARLALSFNLFILILGLSSVLVACQQAQPLTPIPFGETPNSQNPASDIPDLFTEEDIQNAILQIADSVTVLPISAGQTIPDGQIISTDSNGEEDSLTPLLDVNNLSGYVCNIINNTDGRNKWRIQSVNAVDDSVIGLFSVKQDGRAMQSIGCNAQGNKAVFSMKTSSAADYEVYLLDYTGTTRLSYQLTSNSENDIDVSMSADGNTIVWQSWLGSDKVITVRQYAPNGSFSDTVLDGAVPYVEPSINSVGSYIAFLDIQSTQTNLLIHDLTASTTTIAYTTSGKRSLAHPSVSNDGNRVAWIDGADDENFKVKDLTTNTITEIVSNNSNLDHGFLADDGNSVVYSINRTDKAFMKVKNVDDGTIKNVGRVLNPPARYRGSMWVEHNLVFVDVDATGNNDGSSWQDAFPNLQDALECLRNANPNCIAKTEIWIAEGTYYPDVGTNQTNDDESEFFYLVPDVAIYGGFAGTETQRTQRNSDPKNGINTTILSGDIQQDDTDPNGNGIVEDPDDIVGDNSDHVVYVDPNGLNQDFSTATILDGFVITAGQADGVNNFLDNDGGGLACNGSSINDCSLFLENLWFSANFADANGGALYFPITNGIPTIIASSFTNNIADNGGAIYTSHDLVITDSSLTDNVARDNGGGALHAGSGTTISGSNISFDNNTANGVGSFLGQGGAIRLIGSASVNFDNADFTSNNSSLGGAIYKTNGTASTSVTGITLTNSSFTENIATELGGAIYLQTSATDVNAKVKLDLTTVSFTDNESDDSGGAIHSQDANLTLTDVTFTDNSSDTIGGAIYSDFSNITISESTFTSNGVSDGSTQSGGAIYSDHTALNISTTDFIFNGAIESGGAIYTDGTMAHATDITSSSFHGNYAVDKGGAIFNSVDLTINDSTFTNNEAGLTSGTGGAIYNIEIATLNDTNFVNNMAYTGGAVRSEFTGTDLLISRSGFFGNSATYTGGAIDMLSGEINNSVFSGNSADNSGGALYMANSPAFSASSTLTLINTSFSQNSADDNSSGTGDGGSLYINNRSIVGASLTVTLTNNILWNGTDQSGNNEIYLEDADLTVAYNIVKGGAGNITQVGSATLTNAGGNLASNPRFSDADGPDNILGTVDDNLRLINKAPLISPAIDAGDSDAIAERFDRANNDRFVDNTSIVDTGNNTTQDSVVDMGAFEDQP